MVATADANQLWATSPVVFCLSPWVGWSHCFRSHSNSNMLIHPARDGLNTCHGERGRSKMTHRRYLVSGRPRVIPDGGSGESAPPPTPQVGVLSSRARKLSLLLHLLASLLCLPLGLSRPPRSPRLTPPCHCRRLGRRQRSSRRSRCPSRCSR